MSARIIDPAEVARGFNDEVRASVDALDRPLRIVGLLSQEHGPAATYARYAKSGAESVGVRFDLRIIVPAQAAAQIAQANADPEVDGIFLYYPLAGPSDDPWLRELVDPRKDIEGMHSFWSKLLYENRRYLDKAGTVRAVLPCTPLAILKLLYDAGLDGPLPHAHLAGATVTVINRSDIVGRPLAAMLANDGATVYSLDLDGAVVFDPAIGRHAHSTRSSEISRAEALAVADAVITGVPSRDFPLVRREEIKPGAICLNFSQFRNFVPEIVDTAGVFVPRVGPMTVAMANRNLVRLVTGVRAK